jgi:WD40 repeat protein
MCCAWSPHGSLAASCHQDGTVAMWDARSGACVAHTTLPSAARCIKFSATPLDMVAVSEHEERVHLVDARAWRRRQVLALGSGHNGVSGIAFTPSGGRLWVGAENVCVSADIDDVARRTFGAYSFA